MHTSLSPQDGTILLLSEDSALHNQLEESVRRSFLDYIVARLGSNYPDSSGSEMIYIFLIGVTAMNNTTTEASSKTNSHIDEYDIDFNFDFNFSLTDYVLLSLYLVIVLPIEFVNRIISDCYSAYWDAKARRAEMKPLFME